MSTTDNHGPGMVSHLYRIRPLNALLDKHHELERQEIFFAEPTQLNDPMEGLRDVFWQGDRIVWTNLLRHYLKCLNRAWMFWNVAAEQEDLTWRHIPVLQFTDDPPQLRELDQQISEAFFAKRVVIAFIQALSQRTLPVRRQELVAHLRYLHILAITTVHSVYRKRHPKHVAPLKGAAPRKITEAIGQLETLVLGVEKLATGQPDDDHSLDAFFSGHNLVVDQLNLIHHYNGDVDPGLKNKNFLFLEFPIGYVDQLIQLVYPPWYAACFLETCSNSSVWGHYGEGHTGVALKFKAKAVQGRPALRLNRICGLNSAGLFSADVDHLFEPVRYGPPAVEIDFFRSLGRLPVVKLRSDWFMDAAGNRSPCSDEMFRSEEDWRKRHWERFHQSITGKSSDWEYEREYRLVLSGELDFSEPQSRKAKYDFNDLEGIVFGIRTPAEAKRAIAKIVEQKCRATGRTDFRFYQAFYSSRDARIEHAEMRLLKFAN